MILTSSSVILVLFIFQADAGERNCGRNPSQILLRKGEKTRVEFWAPESLIPAPPATAVEDNHLVLLDEDNLQSRSDDVDDEEFYDSHPVSSSPHLEEVITHSSSIIPQDAWSSSTTSKVIDKEEEEGLATTTSLESLIGDDGASGAVKVTADAEVGPLPQGADASAATTDAEFSDQAAASSGDDAEQVPSITTTTNTDLFWETTTSSMLVLTDLTTHDGDQEFERTTLDDELLTTVTESYLPEFTGMTTSSAEEEVSTISGIPMVSDELDSIEVEVSNRHHQLEEASRGSFNDLVMKAADSVEDFDKDSISIELPVMVEPIPNREAEKPSIGDQLKDFSDVIKELDDSTTIQPTEEASIITTEPSIEVFSTTDLPMDEVTTIEPTEDAWLIEMDQTTEFNPPTESTLSSTVPSFHSIDNEIGSSSSHQPVEDALLIEVDHTTEHNLPEESTLSSTVPSFHSILDNEIGSGSPLPSMEPSEIPLTEEPTFTTDLPTTEMPSAEELRQAEAREDNAEEEEESYPEFRYDDILINRIRTIVDSLTNPKESLFFRRTSGFLSSVFRRNGNTNEAPGTRDRRSINQEVSGAEVVRRLDPDFIRFLRSQPLPMRRALSPNFSGRFSRRITNDDTNRYWSGSNSDDQSSESEEDEQCDLYVRTEPGLHLLLTFHNLSAPYTVDCAGAYVEIEREGNGFEARWCGNPIGQQRGVRSHVIFARSEVRVSVFHDRKAFQPNPSEVNRLGDGEPPAPTGFTADIEVIDLHNAGEFKTFQRSEAYSNVHRRMG